MRNRGVFWIVAAVSVGVPATVAAGQTSAEAGCVDFGLQPRRVEITHAGIWPTSCVPREAVAEVGSGVVTIRARAIGEFCLQVFTPFTISATASPPCDGVWQTEVVLLRNDGTEAERIEGPAVLVDCSIADFNNDCAVGVQDVFDFLRAYFSGDPRADVNGVGGVTTQDVFDFLAAYFGGV